MPTLMLVAALLLSETDLKADERPAVAAQSDEIEKERAAEALELCRSGAKEYRLFLDDGRKTELELKTEPVLRWSNPSVGSIHGLVFIWTNRGRPAAIASIFKWFEPLNSMAFEVHSLSEGSLLGNLGQRPVWNSSGPGVEFKPIEGGPRAAETVSARLTQMRNMSKDFTVEKTDRDNDSQQRMRLLTQPILRYQSAAEQVVDGAIFAFVQGTDPEVFLLLEAREREGGTAWYYALARMNSVAFQANYKDQEVWKTEVVLWDTVFDNRHAYNILNLDHLVAPQK
jgi:hypothetical protein